MVRVEQNKDYCLSIHINYCASCTFKVVKVISHNCWFDKFYEVWFGLEFPREFRVKQPYNLVQDSGRVRNLWLFVNGFIDPLNSCLFFCFYEVTAD